MPQERTSYLLLLRNPSAAARRDAVSQLKELGKQFLGGEDKPAHAGEPPAGSDQAQPAAPAKKPEDAIKDKLKGLLR